MDDKKLKKEMISITLIIVNTIFLFITADMFFKFVTWKSYAVFEYSYTFSIFFGVIIYSLIWAIFKKTYRATAISYGLMLILLIINEFKLNFSGEPLYFSDINFLAKAGDLLSMVSQNITSKFIGRLAIGTIIYILILGLMVLANKKFDIEIKNKKIRLGIIIIDVIVLIVLFLPNNYTKELFLKIFFNSENYVDYDSYTTNIQFYYRNGFINGMYGVLLNNTFVEPENYDEEKLNQKLNAAKKGEVTLGKPNVIVVFSESFWDINKLTEVEFDKNVISNYHRLKEEGEIVNLISPTYGGMSENVAFELLTGGSMNYFSTGYIPIMSLYSDKNASKIPSIVHTLNNNGYYSEIVFGKDYYNSKDAYLKMGFGSYKELVKKNESRVSDEYCTDLLIKRLEDKESDKPLLYVLETIESHMPYLNDKYEKYDISITKSNLTDSMNETLKVYAQGLYNADKQLARLYEFIKTYDEPTILVFLGDHLPFLHTRDGQNVIFNLDYFNTEDELLNNYRLYNTSALVLSNYEMENIDLPDYMGTNVLLNYLVNHFDIEVDDYYKWLYNTTDILAASNRYVSLDKEGNRYNTNELPSEMNDIYELRKLMQYKFFINTK